MTIETVRSLYETRPFHPFLIRLADGRAIPVQHREFILSVPSARTLIVVQPDDMMNIIDLHLVNDLELKPAADGSGK